MLLYCKAFDEGKSPYSLVKDWTFLTPISLNKLHTDCVESL
jgi:hypothetical protein